MLWVAAGVRPQDVWQEMDRREIMLGIAEKLPKTPKLPKQATVASARRPIVALDGARVRKRH